MPRSVICFAGNPRKLGVSVMSLVALLSSALGTPLNGYAQQNGQGGAGTRMLAPATEGNSSREAREAAVQGIPFHLLKPEAKQRLMSVIEDASYFRRMPTQTVDCDDEMFEFLVRHPEVIVNIWDVMGVTKVGLKRTGPYQLSGNDGAGTACNMDLVFGNDSMHIYFSNGVYSGNMWPRELKGNCVVILYDKPVKLPNGREGIVASMDVFMKLENIGADLVVKTLGPLVGKTADHNFTECAAFFSQISQVAETNPAGIQQMAKRLTRIDPKVRDQFVATSISVAQKSSKVVDARNAIENGLARGRAENPQAQAMPKDDAASLSSNGKPNSNNANKGAVAQGTKVPSLPPQVPSLSLGARVPPQELSTRRSADPLRAEKVAETDEQVDSPTILRLGSEPTPKN